MFKEKKRKVWNYYKKKSTHRYFKQEKGEVKTLLHCENPLFCVHYLGFIEVNN